MNHLHMLAGGVCLMFLVSRWRLVFSKFSPLDRRQYVARICVMHRMNISANFTSDEHDFTALFLRFPVDVVIDCKFLENRLDW